MVYKKKKIDCKKAILLAQTSKEVENLFNDFADFKRVELNLKIFVEKEGEKKNNFFDLIYLTENKIFLLKAMKTRIDFQLAVPPDVQLTDYVLVSPNKN